MKLVIMWFIRICCRTIAMLKRWIFTEIEEGDLRQGTYEVAVAERKEIHLGWRVFDHRTRVTNGNKSWIVLSGSALPARFSVIADGTTNKILRPAPQKK